MAADTEKAICITGAAEHNLKNIGLDIPRDKLVVIRQRQGGSVGSDSEGSCTTPIRVTAFAVFAAVAPGVRARFKGPGRAVNIELDVACHVSDLAQAVTAGPLDFPL